MRRWLLWCFESRAGAAVARADIFTKLRNSWAMACSIEKMKSWRVIMWLLCEHGVESKQRLSFLSHISSIYSTPRCRCRAQTYTPKPLYLTSETGGLVWAVRLLILGRSPCMHQKCHACMLVCKMYNTSKAPALRKSSQVWVNSAPSRRTTQIICFSNLQSYFSKYMNLVM